MEKVEKVVIKYSDLATIIEGLYYGEDLEIEHTEDLIGFLNDNDDMIATIHKISNEEEEQ